MAHHIEHFNIKELFTTDKYRIPVYQRNYAWGKAEISQLIQDIIDYIPSGNNYYIGTLVVHKQSDESNFLYDTIDGQQRLTTLSILLSVLKNEDKKVDWFSTPILSFESRELSQQAIKFAFVGFFDGTKLYHNTIKEAYDHIKNELHTKIKEANITLDDFVSYLSDKVILLRVEVPTDTDLNHYFEIMNNRGEQLEKHEVVKSLLLDALYDEDDFYNDDIQEFFHIIWDGCANMERYIQFGFEPQLRKVLFSKDWSELNITSKENLIAEFTKYLVQKNKDKSIEFEPLSIEDILDNNRGFNFTERHAENSDRFTSPINFQNFLLHILRIQLQDENIALDDKRLIVFFKNHLRVCNSADKKEFAKEFMYNLVKGKWLLDSYIIKRQYTATKEGWSLKKLTTKDFSKGYYVNTFENPKYLENETMTMLLSMLHVSNPTLMYKYWLNACLNFLFGQSSITFDNYHAYVLKFTKDLIVYRFLNEDYSNRLEYNTLIFDGDSLPEHYPVINTDNLFLQYGHIENNLVFNFIDYILWYNDDEGKYGNFEFTFRSSVEHYYPQNPIGGKKLDDSEALHSFGNLCLISHQKNSKLNHHLPSAKKNYYAKLDHGGQLAYDSIKQFVMMQEYDASEWSVEDIYDHNEKMVEMLNDYIQN